VVGRLGLTDVTPVVGSTATAQFPARAVVGEPITISATVFREGHDAVAASVVLRDAAGRKASVVRMRPAGGGTDRWHADVVADRPGQWSFAVEAWSDPMATWHHAVTAKIEAGQGRDDLANDLEDGARIFDQLARTLPKTERPRVAHRVAPALDAYLQQAAHREPVRELVTASPRYPLWVDRPRALYGSWYEFFPRSIGAELAGDPVSPARPVRHGTLKDSTEHLDYVASLGFDVVYLPPIHPIGEVNRKGPNNTLGHRLARGRPRRRQSRTRHAGRPHRLRTPCPGAGHGGGARSRPAVRARPPVGDRASGMVHHQAGRHDRLRREPAQEVPGHLPA
jgi:starch synthase (maltosyl-transferring)